MKKSWFSKVILFTGLALVSCAIHAAEKKNVVFIICDDLNDNVSGFGGHPQAYTPNLDRLSKMGLRFVNAQCNSPMCAPSRPSLLSGLYASTTGAYGDVGHFRTLPKLKDAVLFPTHFKTNGYQTYCGGKVFHDIDTDMTVFGASGPDKRDGGYLGPKSNFGPYSWDGKTMNGNRPSRDCPNPYLPQTWYEYNTDKKAWTFGHGRLSKLPDGMQWVYSDGGFLGEDGKNGGLFKYNGPNDRSKLPDELVSDWAVKLLLGEPAASYASGKTIPMDQRPFLLTLGFVKTHVALYTPDEFYDAVLKAKKMTEADVVLPWTKDGKILSNDLDDIAAQLNAGTGRKRFQILQQAAGKYDGGLEKMLKDWTMSYLAAVYEIDVQVGKVLDALEETRRLNDTIIILVSDNGWHNGDKECFFKYTLWEQSDRIPFIVCDPSKEFNATRGKVCDAPMSLIDLYPTLNDLCGLPEKTGLDGHSLRPFLKNVHAQWTGPRVALSSIHGPGKSEVNDPNMQSFAVRSKQWRYIVTPDGKEELYNHYVDPYEWTNQAANAEFKPIKITLHKELCNLSGRKDLYSDVKVLTPFE